MNAKKVDLDSLESFGPDTKCHRYARDKGDEFTGLYDTNAHMPVFAPAGRLEGPAVYYQQHVCSDVACILTSTGTKESS